MAEPTVTGVADTPEAAEAFKQFAEGASPNPRVDTILPDDPSQPPKLIGGELNPEYHGDERVAGRVPPGEHPNEDGQNPVTDGDVGGDHPVINDGAPGTDQRTDEKTGAPVDPNFQPATSGAPLPGTTGNAEQAAELRTDPIPSNPVPLGDTTRPADDTPPLDTARDATTIRKSTDADKVSTDAPDTTIGEPVPDAKKSK